MPNYCHLKKKKKQYRIFLFDCKQPTIYKIMSITLINITTFKNVSVAYINNDYYNDNNDYNANYSNRLFIIAIGIWAICSIISTAI